jgi:hypothetical protein
MLFFAVAAPPARLAAQVDVSENPVRGDQVVISWPSGLGNVRLSIYSITGERLVEVASSASSNEYVWDLTVGGGARRVVNGAYVIVVAAGGRHFRRRLFVARPSSSP